MRADDITHLVGVSQDEFPRLERRLRWVCAGNAASLDCRVAHAVSITEGLFLGVERVTILPPDSCNTRQLPIRLPGALQRRLEPLSIRRDRGQHDVDLRRSERLFPFVGAAVAGVPPVFCACGHPLLELRREAVQRVPGNTE